MKNLKIKISLYINYFVFAILLNSVGIVISKSINVYGVTESTASVLEGFKDLPIAIVAFLIASFLPRFGYKKAMLIALGLVMFGCLSMYMGNTFQFTKLLFFTVGVSFAVIKLSVYTLIGVITETKKEHASMMSSIEGFFMIGIAAAYFIFPFFYSDVDPNAWLNVYLFLAVLIGLSFAFLLFSSFELNVEKAGNSLKEDLTESVQLFKNPLVLVFIFAAFFFVMIEQGIMTWLPRFNQKIFSFSEVLSVQMASILALTLAAGRYLAGWFTKRISWFYLVVFCSIVSIILLGLILPQLKTGESEVTIIEKLSNVPFLGLALPIIGLFIAPIYPLLNSTVLSNLEKKLHSSMSGLIIVFSALGGTLGSMIVGRLFHSIGGVNAFYFLIIPLVLLIVCVTMINKMTNK